MIADAKQDQMLRKAVSRYGVPEVAGSPGILCGQCGLVWDVVLFNEGIPDDEEDVDRG